MKKLVVFMAAAVLAGGAFAQCLPTVPGAVINEFSNGNSGNREYIELVVTGVQDGTADLSGWILDDNSGLYTQGLCDNGNSISPGHIRFGECFNAVPVGSIIVLYNARDVNRAINTCAYAADPLDANGDMLYVIPVGDTNTFTCMEVTFETPTANNFPPNVTVPPSPCRMDYVATSYADPGLTAWNAISLNNAGDAVQVVTPAGVPFHAVTYGGSNIQDIPQKWDEATPSSASQKVFYAVSDVSGTNHIDANAAFDRGVAKASYTVCQTPDSVGNETPGRANTPQNKSWIDNCLRAATDPGSRMANSAATKSAVATSVEVYPNPATDAITVAYYSESAATIVIIDMMGKVVYKAERTATGFQTEAIDLSTVPAGIYTYQVQTASDKVIGKVVVK